MSLANETCRATGGGSLLVAVAEDSAAFMPWHEMVSPANRATQNRCTSRAFPIAKGLRPPAQGCPPSEVLPVLRSASGEGGLTKEGEATLGDGARRFSNPNGVVASGRRDDLPRLLSQGCAFKTANMIVNDAGSGSLSPLGSLKSVINFRIRDGSAASKPKRAAGSL